MGLFDSLSEAITGGSNESTEKQFTELREALNMSQGNALLLQENLAQLELAMEDEGWRRFGMSKQMEFTRGGLENLINVARMMYMSNPLIKHAVDVKTFYTWGQGVSVHAADETIESGTIQPMIEHPGNEAELYAQQARLLTDVDQQVEGNVFFRMPTDYDGRVDIRSIPTKEIQDIHTKPGDTQQVWFYRRVWTEDEFSLQTGEVESKGYDKLYPDYRHQPRHKPKRIGPYEVMWDEPIIHQRTGGLKNMRFGIPEVYAALDWARAYKKFLEQWHSIVSSLARFAWKRTTTPEKLEEERRKLNSTVTRDNATEGNPPPAAGSVLMDVAGSDMEPIKTAGVTTKADDARASRLMVAAATGLPDTILSGDVDIGNFATSKTLDRPTELMMRNRQIMWQHLDKAVFGYAIDAKVRRGQLEGKVEYSRFGSESIVIPPEAKDYGVLISYPPVLEHDAGDVVKAIVSAATLDGKMEAGTIERPLLVKMLLEALNVEDVDAEIKNMNPDDQQAINTAVTAVREAAKELFNAA